MCDVVGCHRGVIVRCDGIIGLLTSDLVTIVYWKVEVGDHSLTVRGRSRLTLRSHGHLRETMTMTMKVGGAEARNKQN
jgi:hypothetical protein